MISPIILLIIAYSANAQTPFSLFIGGYRFQSNITDRLRIDLDLKEINTALSQTPPNFDAASQIFNNGRNSVKSNGLLRKLSEMTTNVQDDDFMQPFRTFYNRPDFMMNFISSALSNSGDFVGTSDVFRKECSFKGMQYLTVFNYVLHELYEAVEVCEASRTTPDNNDGDVISDVDEAWAFFTGSLHSPQVNNTGFLIFQANVKRCAEFGTCDPSVSTRSVLNERLAALMSSIQASFNVRDCDVMEANVKLFQKLSIIPLIQGMLKYMFVLAPENAAASTNREKEWAEMLAFAYAVMPHISVVNADVANLIRENTKVSQRTTLKDQYTTLVTAIQSTYPGLGLTCADIGSFSTSQPCVDSNPNAELAGYRFSSDVDDRAIIDKDLQQIESFLSQDRFQDAINLYTKGLNSIKNTGVVRSVKSLTARTFGTEAVWTLFKTYFQNEQYADSLIMNALTPSGMFTNAASIIRKEFAFKTMQYQVLWYYVIHEIEEAIERCDSGSIQDNSPDKDKVLNIDEAWAFFVGTIKPFKDGKLMFRANIKRCEEFKTCSAYGVAPRSIANDKTVAAFVSAQTAAKNLDCTTLKSTNATIVSQMTVPLIQGLLKYVYTADPLTSVQYKSADRNKDWGEGLAFAYSVLPLLNRCSPKVATLVRANFDLNSNLAPMKSGFRSVMGAIRSTYPCLGITCAEVGAFADTEACEDFVPNTLVSGYALRTDVRDRMAIDQDLKKIEEYLAVNDWAKAKELYSKGLFSIKADGSVRNLRDLSISFSKFAKEPVWNLFKNYYGSNTYGDDFVLRALDRQGIFANIPPVATRELVMKGIQYLIIFNYIIHEVDDGYEACKQLSTVDLSNDNDDSSNIDEAWGFYTGSARAKVSSTTSATNGLLMFDTALKRCKEFKTCIANRSPANDQVMALLGAAQASTMTHDCKSIQDSARKVQTTMMAVLIQGLLKYVYTADPNTPAQFKSSSAAEDQAEGLAFAYSLLPFLAQHDASVANLVRSNFEFGSLNAPMKSGYAAVTAAIQSLYPKLGVTCAQIGAMFPEQSCTDPPPTSGAAPTQCPSSAPSDSLSGGAIAGIVIAVVFVYLISIGLCYRYGKKRALDAAAEVDLGKKEFNFKPQVNGNGNTHVNGNDITVV